MAMAYFGQWPKLGDQSSAAVSARITEGVMAKLGARAPEGALYHAEGPSDDGGWWTFGVWASDEHRDAFQRNVLGAVYAEVGIAPGDVRRLVVEWESSRMMTSS